VSSAFGIFAAHKMARTGALVPEFSGGGNLEPFFQTFVRFLFRHFSLISCGQSEFEKYKAQQYMLFMTAGQRRCGKILFSTSFDVSPTIRCSKGSKAFCGEPAGRYYARQDSNL
jgi:hypothetical protein